MKKITKTITALLLCPALLFAAACSCGGTAEDPSSDITSSEPTISSEVSSVVSVEVGADFTVRGFEIDGVSTGNWVTFTALSPRVAYRFSLSFPQSWSSSDERTYIDTSGRTVMTVKAPVVLKTGQKIPDIPGSDDPAYGGIIVSTSDVGFFGMIGKLVVRETELENEDVTIYQYFVTDADAVYRVDFYAYKLHSNGTETAVFNKIMEELVSGK